MNNSILYFLFLSFFVCGFASAAPPPVPQSKKKALEQMDRDLREHQDKAKDIAKSAGSIKAQISKNRKKLVETSREVQIYERDLHALEGDINANEAAYEALQAKLTEDKASIVQLMLAMKRMDDVPLEALMVRPGGAFQAAQSGLVMQDVVEILGRRTARVKEDAETLDVLAQTLETQRDGLQVKLSSLQSRQVDLDQLVRDKERIYTQSRLDLKSQERAAERISLQAKTMKDLLVGLEKQRKKEERERKALKKKKSTFSEVPRFFKKDEAQLPILGVIRTKYGQKDHLDAPSKGLWIEGRPNALVVAPMAGTVRYTGPFKGYGNIIIVEHEKGYHSLIAGLKKIDTVVGHKVVGGEPLGTIGRKDTQGGTPKLYYELRHDGKVINPAKRFADIS